MSLPEVLPTLDAAQTSTLVLMEGLGDGSATISEP